MGGTLLLEADGVTLANASTGILAAFYWDCNRWPAVSPDFRPLRSRARALFRCSRSKWRGVRWSYAINPANQYTLRVRVHCPELSARWRCTSQ